MDRAPVRALRRTVVLTALLLPSVALAASPVERLIGAALADHHAFETVASLCDHVGERLAGSPEAERGVAWALAAMRSAGLTHVHTEPVTVPYWMRGAAEAAIVAPSLIPLHPVALGGSVATPAAGIFAEVVEVHSFAELTALGDKVRGKIVLFNQPMPRTADFSGYGETVPLRGHGAVEAAKLGAIGAIIRSVGTGEYQLAHTGNTRYDPKVEKIPFAAITAEDADLLHRLLGAGPVKIRLAMSCGYHGETRSANVVGELPGRVHPDEIVVLGAHLDSWDLGTGAIDDGAGVAIALETARLFSTLGLRPARTLRVVLYMNEENGLSGARAYAAQHARELGRHFAALEADSGAGAPLGFQVAGGPASLAALRPLVDALGPWLPHRLASTEEAGADLIPLMAAGVPVLSVWQDASSYFDWHHTAADTVDKVDPATLARAVAAYAALTWQVSGLAHRLPSPPKPPRW